MQASEADRGGDPIGTGAQPSGTEASGEVRRHRRRSPSSHRRRHRDLTPEEDNRRRQREAILKILPGILVLLGSVAWVAGIWNPDEYQHHPKLIHVGQAFLLLGGGFYVILLLREWILKIRAAYKERRERMARGEIPRRRRSHRRKHRSHRPSGLRVQ